MIHRIRAFASKLVRAKSVAVYIVDWQARPSSRKEMGREGREGDGMGVDGRGGDGRRGEGSG